MTDVDFLICIGPGQRPADHRRASWWASSITIPQNIVDDILGEKALYQGRSNINGTYSVKKFAVAVPVLSSESQLVGIVLAVMDESEIMQVWRSFIGMFLMTSAIILLICVPCQLRHLHAADQAHHRHGAGHPRLCRR